MKSGTIYIAALIMLVFGMSASWATFARVESMGKNSTFIMDDISIFDNPANINIYPNYLVGEMGSFTDDLSAGSNRDPQSPWFGGIFSLPMGKEDSRDPRLSIAGALNRTDPTLFSLLPDSVRYLDPNGSPRSTVVPRPVTNFDGFLGGSTPLGNMFGSHIYIAYQDGAETNKDYTINSNAHAFVFKGDLGVNWELNQDVDGELSVGLGRVLYGPKNVAEDFFDMEKASVFLSGRLFSTIDAINGELVPAGKVQLLRSVGREEMLINLGMGINVALDRGFFWLGFEYVKNSMTTWAWGRDTVSSLDASGNIVRTVTTYYDEQLAIDKEKDVLDEEGGQVSFGIERNIWWDWFVIRVGGKKKITYRECKPSDGASGYCGESGNYLYTNPNGNGTMGDHIGFGIGVNVEEKLKVDATIAEDIAYRNPFQGSGRLLSRVSATYSF